MLVNWALTVFTQAKWRFSVLLCNLTSALLTLNKQSICLGNTNVGTVIQHMWDQEKAHKKTFDELLPKYRVRPTAMLPIWNVAGFVLGAGTCFFFIIRVSSSTN